MAGIHTLLRSLLILFFVTLSPAAFAQSDAPAADAATESSAPAAQEAAPAEDTGPAFPEGLDDPEIPAEALALLTIPLTVDELTALADAWLDIVKQQTTAVVETQVALPSMPDAEAEKAREQLVLRTEERGRAFDKYTTVVNGLEKKGGDAAAVATYRAYRNSIVVEEKQNADFQTLLKQALSWAVDPEGGIKLALRVGVIVASILGLVIVAKITRRLAGRAFQNIPNLSQLLQGFLALVVYWLTIAFGLMIVLSALGVDITPVFALLGGASFIMAFALQDTLANLASGLMIMINRPFDKGDYVTIAGVDGTVFDVSVVSTTVTTPDNQVIVIPNSKVWGDVITNVTASDTRRVDLVFGIGYDDSIEDAQQVLQQVVADHPLILSDPEPVIRVSALADSSVNLICRPWVLSEDYWTVFWDLNQQVKLAFDERGISIPFPQADMHINLPSGLVPAIAAPVHAAESATTATTGRPKGAPDYATGDHGADEQESED